MTENIFAAATASINAELDAIEQAQPEVFKCAETKKPVEWTDDTKKRLDHIGDDLLAAIKASTGMSKWQVSEFARKHAYSGVWIILDETFNPHAGNVTPEQKAALDDIRRRIDKLSCNEISIYTFSKDETKPNFGYHEEALLPFLSLMTKNDVRLLAKFLDIDEMDDIEDIDALDIDRLPYVYATMKLAGATDSDIEEEMSSIARCDGRAKDFDEKDVNFAIIGEALAAYAKSEAEDDGANYRKGYLPCY